MKNKEKFAKEIVDAVTSGGYGFGFNKSSGEIRRCNEVACNECLFYGLDGIDKCSEVKKDWADSEYIEKPVISKKDRDFLEYLSTNMQYMARDMSDRLYIYTRKPYKQVDCWSSSTYETQTALWLFNIDFPMVKWSDSEPWLIEDLKKLEVVDSYE